MSPALYLRTFKLMADNMMASVPWLLVTEEMAVNSQLPATACGNPEIFWNHGASRPSGRLPIGSSPPVAGENPRRDWGLGRSVGKRPDKWHQWHVEARARARNHAHVYRHHGTVAETDVRLIGSRRGLYGTVPSASTSRPRLRLPTRPSADRSGAPTTWSAASFRYASSSAITGSPAVIASGCSSSVRAWHPR